MHSTIELKLVQPYFDQVEKGIKRFELRKDDRDYKVGDILVLNEYVDGEYTGKEILKMIEYILRDCPEYGLIDGYVILGLS